MSDQFTRVENGKKLRSANLKDALRAGGDLKNETWLFVAPHDDDICIGAGLWAQAGVRGGANVQALVVTDGSMGYCTLEQKDKIVEIRLAETIRSCEILGIPQRHIHSIGYPDDNLSMYQGRRPATSSVEISIGGHVGLQNAFTYHLRALKPSRVFVPTFTDLHPDHQIVHRELMISLFHAGGTIWPELGDPTKSFPEVYEYAVYCDFAAPPTLQVQADPQTFDAKLRSIAAFQSQTQIGGLVESVRKAGPVEYLREVHFKLYSAAAYKPLFT
jgi:LmbE family N-acetylglucosaminyl deacetylase